MTPQYIQWTTPSLLYQTRRKSPLVHKGLTQSFLFQESVAKDSHKGVDKIVVESPYNKVDHYFSMFKNYNLTYTYFTRPVI